MSNKRLLKFAILFTAIVVLIGSAKQAHAQPTQPTTNPATTRPVVMLQPPAGTVIENLNLRAADQPTDRRIYGIYVNGSKGGLTIRNCRIEGFNFGIALTGGNAGFQIYNCTIVNSASPAGKDSSGIYAEGAYGGASVHDNVILNTGWWPEYDPSDPNQRAVANRHHSYYGNEGGGTDDSFAFYDNVCLDPSGSNVILRRGGVVYGNVFRPGGDWDVVAASLGGNGFVVGNAHFGPRTDAVPYYGGGIRRYGNMLCRDNLFAGSAGITNNVTCYDNATNSVIPQLGWWTKPGAGKLVPAGAKVPTLEDYYGTPDVYAAAKPGDAPKIIAWLRGLTLAPAPVVVTPAPRPAPFDVTIIVDPRTGKATIKP
jgi:hypothetical protein